MGKSYCVFDTTTTHLGSGNVLVHAARTGKSNVLLPSEAEFLLSCQDFESLTTHAKRHCRKRNQQLLSRQKGLFNKFLKWVMRYVNREETNLPIRKQEVESYRKKLEKWVEAGFLISKSDLKDKVTDIAQHNEVKEIERNDITVVGIPTCGRPLMLQRCLQSFINNFNHHSRTPDIIILDDSRDKEIQKKNQIILQQLNDRYYGDFYYMNRP